MSNKISQNPWTMDVRVRERNLKSGALTEKDLEKQLAALPDLEGQYDSFGTAQPALEQPRVAAPVAAAVSSSSSGADESDSDLDDEDDEDEDEGDDNDSEESTPDVAPSEGGGEGGGES